MTTIKREELHEIIMLAVNHKRDRCYIKHVLGLNYGSIYINQFFSLIFQLYIFFFSWSNFFLVRCLGIVLRPGPVQGPGSGS